MVHAVSLRRGGLPCPSAAEFKAAGGWNSRTTKPVSAVNIDFDAFRHLSLIDILDRYVADPQLNWQNTLEANKAPPGLPNWMAGYHLAAAFFIAFAATTDTAATGASGN